jgi:hypothetical protein
MRLIMLDMNLTIGSYDRDDDNDSEQALTFCYICSSLS